MFAALKLLARWNYSWNVSYIIRKKKEGKNESWNETGNFSRDDNFSLRLRTASKKKKKKKKKEMKLFVEAVEVLRKRRIDGPLCFFLRAFVETINPIDVRVRVYAGARM